MKNKLAKMSPIPADGGKRKPSFYMLPKIHKNMIPPPMETNTMNNDCPTERISALVDHFLRPVVQETKLYVKNSRYVDDCFMVWTLSDRGETPRLHKEFE